MLKYDNDFCILSYNTGGYYYRNTFNKTIKNKKLHMTKSKKYVV